MVVAFIGAATLVPAAGAQANPVGIPPGSLGQCDITAGGGGWALRDFIASGTDLANATPVRPRALRLSEPCVSGSSVTIQGALNEVASSPGVWTVPSDAGGGAGPGGSGTIGLPGASYSSCFDADNCLTVLGTVPNSEVQGGHTYVYTTTCFRLTGSGRVGPSSHIGPTWHGLNTRVSADARYYGFQNYTYGASDKCPAGSNMSSDELAPTHVYMGPEFGSQDHDFFTFDTMQWCDLWQDPYSGCVGTAHADVPPSVKMVDGLQASKMLVGNTSALTGGEQGRAVCATDNNGGGSVTLPITSTFVSDASHPASMNDPAGYSQRGDFALSLVGASSCAYLTQIFISVCVFVAPNGPTAFSCVETQWNFDQYARHPTYGGQSQDQFICKTWSTPSGGCTSILYPPYTDPEAAIVCALIPAGGDIVSLVGNAVSLVPGWFGCMLAPRGWDRAGTLSAAWAAGPPGQLIVAYRSAIPTGIACGAVASVPLFGYAYALDTCSADIAPDWVKNGVGWLLVLGLGVAVVRRILWAVGSR